MPKPKWKEKCIGCKRVDKSNGEIASVDSFNDDQWINRKEMILWHLCDKCWNKGRRPKNYFEDVGNPVIRFCKKCRQGKFSYKYFDGKAKKICKNCGHEAKNYIKNIRKGWDD